MNRQPRHPHEDVLDEVVVRDEDQEGELQLRKAPERLP